jgi:carboxymethylenebutenolidase
MDKRVIDLYQEYRNHHLDRRSFLKRLVTLAGGSAAAVSLIPLLEKKFGHAQVIPKNDSRLEISLVNYPGETGKINAYLARPSGAGKYPAVMVIHENKGLVPHIRDVTRRVALEGFLALAPDALSPLGGTPNDPDEARSRMRELDRQSTIKNYVAAVKFLKTHPQTTGKVGCMGFCWGGGVTNQVAVLSPHLNAAVPFYGSQPETNDVSRIKASLLCHYGSLDTRINQGIEGFEKALKAHSIRYKMYMYEGAKHAFFNDTRPDRYHKDAADLAWKRTIEFFKKELKT